MASSHAKTQHPDHGLHDMISKLTDRLVSLGQGTAPEHDNNNHHAHPHDHHNHHDNDQGVRIITLAGENKGAAMKAMGLDELVDTQGMIYTDEHLMSAYTNSNYQAVNNSIVLEGSCEADDPGVHIEIIDKLDRDDDDDGNSDDMSSDSEESDEEERKAKKKESTKKGKKKKKKKGLFKRKNQSQSEEEEKTKHAE